jgi:hypothetical protein
VIGFQKDLIQIKMKKEILYARNYEFMILNGLTFPIAKKEEYFWKYRNFIEYLKANDEHYNERLFNYLKELRNTDLEIFLKQVSGN